MFYPLDAFCCPPLRLVAVGTKKLQPVCLTKRHHQILVFADVADGRRVRAGVKSAERIQPFFLPTRTDGHAGHQQGGCGQGDDRFVRHVDEIHFFASLTRTSTQSWGEGTPFVLNSPVADSTIPWSKRRPVAGSK